LIANSVILNISHFMVYGIFFLGLLLTVEVCFPSKTDDPIADADVSLADTDVPLADTDGPIADADVPLSDADCSLRRLILDSRIEMGSMLSSETATLFDPNDKAINCLNCLS
jgi:hypothetical protein